MGLLKEVHFAPFGVHVMYSTVAYHIRHRLILCPVLPIAIFHRPSPPHLQRISHPFHEGLPTPFTTDSSTLSRRTPYPPSLSPASQFTQRPDSLHALLGRLTLTLRTNFQTSRAHSVFTCPILPLRTVPSESLARCSTAPPPFTLPRRRP